MEVTTIESRACRGLDVNLFYAPERRAEALVVCDSCPVQLTCTEAHLTERVDCVIGTTTSGRRRLRRWIEVHPEATDDERLAEIRSYNQRSLDGSGRDLVSWKDQPDEWVRAVRLHRERTNESVDLIAVRYRCSTQGVKKILSGEVRADAGGPIAGEAPRRDEHLASVG